VVDIKFDSLISKYNDTLSANIPQNDLENFDLYDYNIQIQNTKFNIYTCIIEEYLI